MWLVHDISRQTLRRRSRRCHLPVSEPDTFISLSACRWRKLFFASHVLFGSQHLWVRLVDDNFRCIETASDPLKPLMWAFWDKWEFWRLYFQVAPKRVPGIFAYCHSDGASYECHMLAFCCPSENSSLKRLEQSSAVPFSAPTCCQSLLFPSALSLWTTQENWVTAIVSYNSHNQMLCCCIFTFSIKLFVDTTVNSFIWQDAHWNMELMLLALRYLWKEIHNET